MTMRGRIALAVGCLVLPCLAQAAPLYSLTPFEAVNPEDSIHPTTINDRGQVAGAIRKPAPGGASTYHPFFWDGTGPARELVGPAGTVEYAFGYAMNNRGEVLAAVRNQNGLWQNVTWSPDGSARTVAPPPGFSWAAGAGGLNDAGTILTYGMRDPDASGSGLRLHADGSVDELPGFIPTALTRGGAALGGQPEGPVVWERDGTVRPLLMTGFESGSERARAINDAGWVAGDVFFEDAASLALWRPDGTLMIAARAFREPDNASGEGINNHGEVVGYGFKHSMYWSEADGVVNLQTRLDASGAGWELGAAMDINDAGQIVASAFRVGDAARRSYGVVLTPVPEPAGALAGVVVLAVMATRRRGE